MCSNFSPLLFLDLTKACILDSWCHSEWTCLVARGRFEFGIYFWIFVLQTHSCYMFEFLIVFDNFFFSLTLNFVSWSLFTVLRRKSACMNLASQIRDRIRHICSSCAEQPEMCPVKEDNHLVIVTCPLKAGVIESISGAGFF